MSIYITAGEINLIEAFKQRGEQINVENILIGDILIKNERNDIIYIIERKAKGDLDASIKDGRYKEQKSRLLETNIAKKNIIYLIENLKTNVENKSRNWGAVCNTFHRDGCSIFQTKNIEESVDFLLYLAKSVSKFPNSEKMVSNNEPVNINIKKKTVAPEDWLLYSLSLIPKCSIQISKSIINEYKSYGELYQSAIENGIYFLSEIKINGGRRIGKKLSEEIYNYIMAF